MIETRRQQLNILRGSLDTERASYISHWRDIADVILPRRPQFTVSDTNKGDRRNQKIIDETGTYAARTLQAGIMGGMTSPARPWKRLSTSDPDLSEFGPVKDWLHIVDQRMNTVFLRSNLYNALPTVYGDIGVFGTAAMAVEEDFDNVIRCYPFALGSYWLATNDKLQVDVFMREFRLTVRQLVQRFGRLKERSGSPDWAVFSPNIKSQYESGRYDTWVDVSHVIQPNLDYNPNKLASKRYESLYYETGMPGAVKDEGQYLRESGYDLFPVLAPRWEVTGEDVYGTNCPGMIALGGVKQLQLGEKRIMQAVEKMINPAMIGPTSLRTAKASILPGDITYLDEREGQKGFRAAHDVNFKIEAMENKQEQVRNRIRKAFYEDLFLMFASLDRTDITATEINARREEKLLVLGPVLEQLNQDLLDPLVDLTFEMMMRQGLIPPPPEELQGQPLKVEYISIMHQAQKAAGLAGIERLASFAGQIAEYDPTVLDKIDRDQLIDEYANITGIPPRIIKSDDQVSEIRAQRAQAVQAQQQAQMMAEGAKTAKDLSGADLSGDNALAALVRQSQAGALA